MGSDSHGNTPRTPTATRSTAFASPLVGLIPFILITFVMALFGFSAWACCWPFFPLAWRMCREEVGRDTTATRFLKTGVLVILWCSWHLFVVWVLCAAVTSVSTILGFASATTSTEAATYAVPPIGALAIYVVFFPMLLELGKGPGGYALPYCIIMHVGFDIPLTVIGLLLREVTGLRLFPPFASIMDDEIVQGSMPFPSDAAEMAAPPLNVCAVVNMCREWPGPTSAYSKYGISQLRLSTQDTTCPTPSDLRTGAKFIADQLEQNPGKRVFVHCKGGIARASTMVLAHYILNKGADPDMKIREMQRKRSIVYSAVADYHAIRKLVDDRDK